MKILSRKQIKKILSVIDRQFGVSLDLDYIFLQTSKDRIFIVSKDFEKLNFKNFKKINNVGLYFAKIEKDGIRLSIEGSQLIGNKASKNILELEDSALWMQGKDIPNTKNLSGYLLVKCKNDFLGTGKALENKILNFIPKARRTL